MNSEPQSGTPGEDVYLDPTQQVSINPLLMGRLRHAAIQGLLAIPKRGVEIGGLLLGKIRHEPPFDVFEIAASVSVPCEYRFGPSYILDDTDRGRLVELLARYQEGEYPHAVGFYRSYTGRVAALDDADRDLLRTFFSGQRNVVCLLLQPLSRDTCTADVRFWQTDGEFQIPAPVEPVADIIHVTDDNDPEIPAETRRPAPVLPIAVSRNVAEEHGQPAPQPSPRFRMLLPSLLLLVTAIAAGAIYQTWQAARDPGWPEVRLDAQPAAGALLISWDTSVRAVARATRGTLVANEGGAREEIPLRQDQLRRGSFAYSRPGGSTLFQLRLYDKDGPIAQESLRVIQPSVAATAPPAAAQATPPASLASELQPGDAVKPPAVRQEAQPYISPGIRARILSRTVVPVMVSVNSSGHVTKASAKVGGGGMERYLAGEAVKAARRWSFWPARSKEGSPVAGTTTISIEFTPATN